MCYTYSIVSMHEKKYLRLFSLKIVCITRSKENNVGDNTRECLIELCAIVMPYNRDFR